MAVERRTARTTHGSCRPASLLFSILMKSFHLLLLLTLLVSANALVPLNRWSCCRSRSSTISDQLQPSSFRRRKLVLRDDAASPLDSDNGQDYSVEVSYEGRSCQVRVRPNETLLAAMERAGAADQLSLPSLPSDCRRGNCLTCSGRHAKGSNKSNVVRGEDGLSPHMSREVQNGGYLLTCSTFVQGNGVKIALGENDSVWNDLYKERLEDERAVHIGRVAKARVIRRAAESNLPKWRRQTEKVLDQTVE